MVNLLLFLTRCQLGHVFHHLTPRLARARSARSAQTHHTNASAPSRGNPFRWLMVGWWLHGFRWLNDGYNRCWKFFFNEWVNDGLRWLVMVIRVTRWPQMLNDGSAWLILADYCPFCTHWLYSRGKSHSFLCTNHQYWIVNKWNQMWFDNQQLRTSCSWCYCWLIVALPSKYPLFSQLICCWGLIPVFLLVINNIVG